MQKVAVILCLALAACAPPSALEIWQQQMQHRCFAMRAKIHFVSPTQAECFRTPVFRMPKRVFNETYKGP